MCAHLARKVFGDWPGPAMDSEDEEALTALLEEEAEVDIQGQEHLMVLAALAGLLASSEKPRRGGSALGRVKAKNRHLWKATACSTRTTSPTLHCTLRKHFGAIIG